MKFGLENISRLCEHLDHPERAFASVIVAGTNGKGSVTAMIHHGLVAAGHRAARYTSPHLERFEERYVIGQDEVASRELEGAAREVRHAVDALLHASRLAAPPTFFECATAMAFVLFREARVEVAVLEVGLGGRLDATNVVTPVAAAITSIDFDHQAQLGSTLAAIAAEKAGVIKPGIPVVCGDLPAPAEAVVRSRCAELEARYLPASACGRARAIADGTPLALAGAHQRGNARVAACVLQQLDANGISAPPAAIEAAIRDVRWPGRLELVRSGVDEILLDAAHNPAGARALAAHLRESGWTPAILVFGAMADKDVQGMLDALAPACASIVCTEPAGARAMRAAAVASLAAAATSDWRVQIEPDPARALALARRAARRVVVAGSIFLTGPLRGILRAR